MTLKAVVLASMLAVMVTSPARGIAQESVSPTTGAHRYIDAFRHGDDLTRPLQGLVDNHRIHRAAVAVLAKELAVAPPDVREKLVGLLQEMAFEDNPPGPTRFRVIRDPSIIEALLTAGLAKDDAASGAAANALLVGARPADLSKFRKPFMHLLASPQAPSVLLLVAKAKIPQTRALVERMAALPQFQGHEDIRIAQAALGNTAVEDDFLAATRKAEQDAPPAPRNRFYDVGDAKDGKGLAEQLALLGQIGTRRSLQAVCSHARSPLKTYLPDHWERSVRLDAFRALAFNFPDERVLVDIDDLAGYAAAERFCTQHLGAVFDGPTPDLPPDLAYPIMWTPPTWGRFGHQLDGARDATISVSPNRDFRWTSPRCSLPSTPTTRAASTCRSRRRSTRSRRCDARTIRRWTRANGSPS